MKVACPVCWHSVVTIATCRECGLVQCMEYEGPVCIACGGVCMPERTVGENPEATEAAPPEVA